MKKILSLIVAVVFITAQAGCDRDKTAGNDAPSGTKNTRGNKMASTAPTATIETDFGNIVIEFYNEDAPNTVDNFIKLAKKGYYDGVTFHRIVPGFVIQGGDPQGNGMGGPGYTIAAEFNSRKHLRGTVSMARKGNDINSAGSQFYICLGTLPNLDNQYTVFGQVIEGMDAVDKIAAVPTGAQDKPKTPVKMNKVTINE